MRKSCLKFMMLAVTPLLALFTASCSGSPADVQAEPGQEVSLEIGQQLNVTGEDLSIRFIDVVEDSRCPKDVTCVWQGQATCSLQITAGGTVQDVKITEPGLHGGFSEAVFGDYRLSFRLLPYPESTTSIAKEDYRLMLTCAAVETEADFTGFITDIQPAEQKLTGHISVESHADKLVTKYVVSINADTRIFQQSGDSLVVSSFDALENKQWVQLWFSGPVMESFPMQATAGQIVIME